MPMAPTFTEVRFCNSFARLKTLLILYLYIYMKRLPDQKYTFQKTQALSVIKTFWRSHTHEIICFQSLGIKYPHDMN